MTHEGMSGTHGLRGESTVTILHEEYLELQVTEERFDTKGLDQAWDHELPPWERGLDMEEVFEYVPCVPTNREVYAYID